MLNTREIDTFISNPEKHRLTFKEFISPKDVT